MINKEAKMNYFGIKTGALTLNVRLTGSYLNLNMPFLYSY